MSYQIWLSRGRGLESSERFNSMEDALRFVDECPEPGLAGIRLPCGNWYKSPQTGQVMNPTATSSQRRPQAKVIRSGLLLPLIERCGQLGALHPQHCSLASLQEAFAL